LPAKALRGTALSALSLGAFESVKAAPNRLSVDAELVGEVGQALACANPPTDPLDLLVRQFEFRCHTLTVLPWDISRDIMRGEVSPNRMLRNACKEAKNSSVRAKSG